MTGSEPEVRQVARHKHTRPLLEQFRRWLDSQMFLPKSPLGQPATYTHNQWGSLCRYVKKGGIFD